ncbi:MAG: hypothetical protein AAGA85_24525 [Bacteroidota bacterium]
MIITKELLRRYHQGLCNDEERRAVERWLNSDGDLPTTTDLVPKDQFEEKKDLIWSKMVQTAPELSAPDGGGIDESDVNTPVVPLYRSMLKYAAAACILFAVFFGGRFSVRLAQAHPMVDHSTADHLYIFGWKDVQGHLPGDEFQLKFEGTLKLYNSALSSKTIYVGDTSMVLEGNKHYYLTGNTKNPQLTDDSSIPKLGKGLIGTLAGDFAIHRLDR